MLIDSPKVDCHILSIRFLLFLFTVGFWVPSRENSGRHHIEGVVPIYFVYYRYNRGSWRGCVFVIGDEPTDGGSFGIGERDRQSCVSPSQFPSCKKKKMTFTRFLFGRSKILVLLLIASIRSLYTLGFSVCCSFWKEREREETLHPVRNV